ncbi:MAG: peptidase S41, partial [Pseudomonadota bacterium]
MGVSRIFACFAVLASVAPWVAQAQVDGYLRDPALHNDTLIFSSEGDLWRTDLAGGTATRITTHPETERGSAISPDGETIAFNANYDGPTEVYVAPVTGGPPKRVTFEGGGVSVQGWT